MLQINQKLFNELLYTPNDKKNKLYCMLQITKKLFNELLYTPNDKKE